MAHRFQKLGSFAGDYSGAASVLQDLDGLLIFCDAGACMGGFLYGEDPKGGNEERKIFSASLREKQVVMGIDKKLKKDAIRTYRETGGAFVGLIGTPVSAVIGTDLDGLGKEICKELQKETLTQSLLHNLFVDTNGLEYYDSGQEKAYQALADTFIDENLAPVGDVHVIGATSIDMWDYNQITDCINLLKEAGAKAPIVWGANGGIHEIAGAAGARLNVAVSVSGMKTVKALHKKYGTPYVVGYPMGIDQTQKWKRKIHALLSGEEWKEEVPKNRCESGKRALIIGEQITSCAIRNLLETEFTYDMVDVASFFKMDKELRREHDLSIKEEMVLSQYLKEQEVYDLIIADPMCYGLLPYEPQKKIILPHIAVSAVSYIQHSPNLFGEKASLYFKKMLNEDDKK